MGKILRLNKRYPRDSAYLYKAQQVLLNVLKSIRYLAVTGSKQPATPEQYTTTYTLAREAAYTQEKLEKLEFSALRASAAQPAKFHDLLKLLTLEDQSKPFSFDLGEYMARKGLAETCFRASRICIKITPQGLDYLKAQESEQL